jgi:hypothetical protein
MSTPDSSADGNRALRVQMGRAKGISGFSNIWITDCSLHTSEVDDKASTQADALLVVGLVLLVGREVVVGFQKP